MGSALGQLAAEWESKPCDDRKLGGKETVVTRQSGLCALQLGRAGETGLPVCNDILSCPGRKEPAVRGRSEGEVGKWR